MLAKRTIAALFACVLALAMVACNNNRNGLSSVPSENPSTTGAGTELSPSPSPLPEISGPESEADIAGERYGREEFLDENVSIDLDFDRADYTVNDIIGLNVKITNNSDKTIAFLHGSGSNSVPEGLQINLGELTAMYRPAVSTMDYRVEELAPGDSVSYELPYAPFIALNPDEFPAFGADKSLDAFRDNEAYRPVEVGRIDGTLRFTYAVIPEETPTPMLYNFEGEDARTIEGAFNMEIVE